jgi:hypothetical protein
VRGAGGREGAGRKGGREGQQKTGKGSEVCSESSATDGECYIEGARGGSRGEGRGREGSTTTNAG